jgi:hypothetical protein
MNDPIEIAVALLISLSSIGVLGVTGALAFGLIRRWSRPAPELPSAELDELRKAMDHLAGEVTDLHERVDFAERVLAQRDQPRLKEGA